MDIYEMENKILVKRTLDFLIYKGVNIKELEKIITDDIQYDIDNNLDKIVKFKPKLNLESMYPIMTINHNYKYRDNFFHIIYDYVKYVGIKNIPDFLQNEFDKLDQVKSIKG